MSPPRGKGLVRLPSFRGWWCRHPRLRVLLAGLLLLPFLLLLLRLLFFSGPHLPVETARPLRVVDMHCHTAGIGAGGSGCSVSDTFRSSYKFRIYLRSFGVTLEDLEAQGDALVIRRIARWVRESSEVDAAIVLALDGVIDAEGRLDARATQVYVPNQFVRNETARHPELLFGASINPMRTNAVELLHWAHQRRARLVKWLPSIQLFDPADRAFVPFYQKLVELDLPLLVHVGAERAFTGAREEWGDPHRLRLALDTGVRVIAAHMATTGRHEGERDIDRLLELMERYPRLHADISSLTQINKAGFIEEVLRNPLLQGRLFYGSDFPLINSPLVSPWYFPLNLEAERMRAIADIGNPWDRDVALKRALGFPAEIFGRAATLLLHPHDLPVPDP